MTYSIIVTNKTPFKMDYIKNAPRNYKNPPKKTYSAPK